MAPFLPEAASEDARLRVRAIADGRFQVRSLDDSRNVLQGLTVRERFAVLDAVHAVLPELRSAEDVREREALFVHWAALEMLHELQVRTKTPWGHGTIGDATTRASLDRRRGARKPSARRRPMRLMLNLIDGSLLPPEFRRLPLASLVRALRESLNHELRDWQIALPSSVLSSKVLPRVAESLGGPHRVPARLIALTLSYYGIASARHARHGQQLFVMPWRLHITIERLAMGPLSLDSLPWSRDRYQLANGVAARV